MAEFCLDCLNRLEKKQYTEKDIVLSEELDLCEGCGKWKRVVIRFRFKWWWLR